jgi:hypothetical protein
MHSNIDIVTVLRARLDDCGCESKANQPCGGCAHDQRTLNEITRLRDAIANWSRVDQEWLNIDVPTAEAMEKLRVAERHLRAVANIPQPRERTDATLDGELE